MLQALIDAHDGDLMPQCLYMLATFALISFALYILEKTNGR